MATRIAHTPGRELEVRLGDRLVLRYVYAPEVAAVEAPKPYFHPLRTLAGETVTLFRPHDHVWHHGLAMTCANLSGENFWGGATYVTGRGYVQLDNVGRIAHEEWEAGGPLVERLAWITHDGERWLEERRTIGAAALDAGSWALWLGFVLRNVSGRRLDLGSPTTAGRPLAGYGGLFWRGPRSFLGGRILAGGGLEGPEVMGRAAPWLALAGRHDGTGASSTVVFVDHPDNPRHPTKWFVRNDPYACASCSFMFDEVYPLGPGEELALRYVVIVCDGAWEPARIARQVRSLVKGAAAADLG